MKSEENETVRCKLSWDEQTRYVPEMEDSINICYFIFLLIPNWSEFI